VRGATPGCPSTSAWDLVRLGRRDRPPALGTNFRYGDVTASEQLMLELINFARLDPAGEAQRLGIDLNAGLRPGPSPPIPSSRWPSTICSLRRRAIIPSGQIDTTSSPYRGRGSSPGDRMAAAGYAFTGLWGWGENIAWRGVAPGPIDPAAAISLQHDSLFLSPGHRTNLLNEGMREIGVGQSVGSFIRTARTGRLPSSRRILRFLDLSCS